MKKLILIIFIFQSAAAQAQTLEKISSFLIDIDHKKVNYKLYEQFEEKEHTFTISESKVDSVKGIVSNFYFSNRKDKHLTDEDIKELSIQFYDEISNHHFERVFISADNKLSTFRSNDPTKPFIYLELYIPNSYEDLTEIIFYDETYASSSNGNNISSISNPSFEYRPRIGNVGLSYPYQEWKDCSYEHFPKESQFDVHSDDTKYWNVSVKPSDGETFIGLVTRNNDSWESISQEFNVSLIEFKCYSFSIDVCTFPKFTSRSRAYPNGTIYYSDPISLDVYLSNELCKTEELVYSSIPIESQEWEKLNITFESNGNYKYIVLAANNSSGKLMQNGNILLDNITEFKEFDCKN